VRLGAAGLVLAAILAACAGQLPLPDLDRVDRVREGAADSAKIAPDAYARAEALRRAAHRAHDDGDDVAATLLAEHAAAAYADAEAAARVARASLEAASAQAALDDATARLAALNASRSRLEGEAAELEKLQQVIEQRLETAASKAASPEREAARRVAADALLTQARLLCGAAKLVSPTADGLDAAQTAIAAASDPSSKSAPSARIDAAAKSRADCLDVLVRARRGAVDAPAVADELLTELSAAGSWSPKLDERGVVVTLRDLFRGGELTDDGSKRLADLGRVAGSHPSFGIQVVVHDAAPPANAAFDAKRAEVAVQALVAAGAGRSAVASELAGAKTPVADASDPRSRARNERLDVVFVVK
jgi:flagellar motor protein MotB